MPTTDSAATNKALILDYYAALAGQGNRPIGDFFAADVVWHVPQSNPMIKPNPRRGHAAVMDLLAAGIGIYKEGSLQIDRQRIIADESQVGVQFTLTAQLANGNPYVNQYFFLFSIADGRIDGVWEYLDTLYQADSGALDSVG
jgi:ketosteroid isomerase-like protein